MFTIEPVDGSNLAELLSLELFPHQLHFIEPVESCLHDAKECRFYVPVALRLSGKVVGFAMYGEFPNKLEGRRVWLDRLLLDKRHQGRGLGRRMVQELLAHLREKYRCKRIYLSIFEDNEAAQHIYESLGFRFNGELDLGGERIMVLEGGELH